MLVLSESLPWDFISMFRTDESSLGVFFFFILGEIQCLHYYASLSIIK